MSRSNDSGDLTRNNNSGRLKDRIRLNGYRVVLSIILLLFIALTAIYVINGFHLRGSELLTTDIDQENAMFLETISVGPLETNCYIIAAEHAKEAIVIDPGDNAGMIMDTIAAEDLDVKYVLLTHAHWDHFGAAFEVAEKTGAKIAIHTLDKPALTAPEKSLAFMFEADSTNSTGGLKVDMELEDGQSIKFGDIEAHILHTPGHSPGSVSVLIGDSLFTGDLIFYRSIGRTDFAGGSHSALMKSVNEKIFKYPDQVKIYPGHGPATTVGDERKNNPYF